MFALNTRKLSTTLFISLAVLVTIATVVEASHDLHQQRDHVNLKRIIKKRAPQILELDEDTPIIGAAPLPGAPTTPATPTDTTSTPADTTTTDTPSTTDTDTTSTGTDTTSTTGTDTSSTDTSSSTTSTTTESSTTTPPAQQTSAPPPAEITSTLTSQIKSTTTVVANVDATQSVAPLSAAQQTSSNIVTILVAIAASLGGVAILWTVFRKWKLGSSKRFEERLQPIDWKSPSHDDHDGLPAHRRTSISSFRSGPSGSAAPRSGGLSPIPDHDFTATGNVSPVGGYADMSRGPSPPMRENRGYEFSNGISGGRY